MRLVLKISGESLKGTNNIGEESLKEVCNKIKDLSQQNELIIIVGGGNFWRGRNTLPIKNATSDYIGMLATIMNTLALSSYLDEIGVSNRAYSSFDIPGVIKKASYKKVISDLALSKVIIFGGGLGIPNLSTDMTMVSRAIEFEADAILALKNIDGVYDKDPKEGNAKKFDLLTHQELFDISFKEGTSKLMIFDPEALVSLLKHKIPVYVFNYKDLDNISDVFNGKIGTRVIS
ncbi:MAG: UMP kinase [bacterium]|nr:UMP kinase [bacterium]